MSGVQRGSQREDKIYPGYSRRTEARRIPQAQTLERESNTLGEDPS